MQLMERWGLKLDEATIQTLLLNPKCDQKCEILHRGDCNTKALIQLAMGVKGVFKIYLLAHLIPFLLFRFKNLRKNPRKELWTLFVGIINSLMYASITTALAQRIACFLIKYSSNSFTIIRYPAALAGVSLLFESRTRQVQITLYCVSKGLDAAYAMLKRRKYPVTIPCGNLWINGASLAIIAFAFLNDPTLFREGYRRFLGLLLSDI